MRTCSPAAWRCSTSTSAKDSRAASTPTNGCARANFDGEIVFLTGHAPSHPAVARAAGLGVRVLSKPVETAELRALVERA